METIESPVTTLPPMTPGEENCLKISAMVKKVHCDMLELGELLWENREKGYWGTCGAGSFKDFIQMLQVSYDWATRMVDLIDATKKGLLPRDQVERIGVAKACLLLPHAKKGDLTENVLAVAENGTWNALRQELGHNLTEPDGFKEFLHCPRCGNEFQLLPGMVERR